MKNCRRRQQKQIKLGKEAEASKQQRINEANAQKVRLRKCMKKYVKNPLITKQRMFYEAMEEVLPDVRLIIDDGSGDLNKTLYLDELQLKDITIMRILHYRTHRNKHVTRGIAFEK